ncbi:transthyretin [Dentipellis sp. KUC8613]|nr:transthyretin [Dentipellis sp. KUC8613]
MSRSPITCHILDSSLGKPAAGVQVRLQECKPSTTNVDVWESLAEGETDSDGRCTNLLPVSTSLRAGGLYKMVFKVKPYFEQSDRKCFYPWVEIPFEVVNAEEHYHIPLLISPYSYTTYRGS